MGQYTKEMFERDLKARREQEAKEEEARGARMEKEGARRAWLRDGGSEADFEKEWPSLRDQARRQRVMDADRRAREQMRNGTTSRI